MNILKHLKSKALSIQILTDAASSRNSQMSSVTIKRVLCSPSLFCRFILDFVDLF